MKIDKIPADIEKIVKKLASSGFEVAIVGGAVRQMLKGEKITDWDLTTNAKPQQIQKLFAKSFYNNRFGTVGVAIPDGQIAQITTYRTEEKYTDKRHPDVIVWGKSLEEDLKRRDFTINAMALRLSSTSGKFEIRNSKFEIIDIYDGKGDLDNKIIRTVGDPNERFKEDALRLLRAVRFATILNFSIEEKTFI